MKIHLEENKPEIKIGQAALYLFSIFNQMKSLALTLEGQADDEEVKLFLNDLPNFCEIGYAVTDSIYEAASNLDTESETFLAVQLSDLMNNPTLPVEVFNAFQSAFDDLRNELPSKEKLKLETHELTPEYMTDFLNCYKKENE